MPFNGEDKNAINVNSCHIVWMCACDLRWLLVFVKFTRLLLYIIWDWWIVLFEWNLHSVFDICSVLQIKALVHSKCFFFIPDKYITPRVNVYNKFNLFGYLIRIHPKFPLSLNASWRIESRLPNFTKFLTKSTRNIPRFQAKREANTKWDDQDLSTEYEWNKEASAVQKDFGKSSNYRSSFATRWHHIHN